MIVLFLSKMTYPETNIPQYNLDPTRDLTDRVRATLEREDPDVKQRALLLALLDTVQKDGLGPNAFELLEGMYKQAADAREKAMTTHENTADAIGAEVAEPWPTGQVEVQQGNSSYTAHEQAPTNEIDVDEASHVTEIGNQAAALAVETSAFRIDGEEKQEITKEVERIAEATFSRAVFGKFAHGVHLRSVGKVENYSVKSHDGDDYESFSHSKSHRKYLKAVGRSMGKLRGEVFRRDPGHPLNTTPLLMFNDGITMKDEPASMLVYSFPNDLLDGAHREILDMSVSVVLPLEEANKLRKLISDHPEALDEYLHMATGGFRELDEGRIGRDKFMVGDDNFLNELVELDNLSTDWNRNHGADTREALGKLKLIPDEHDSRVKVVNVPPAV
jgi:hypothetical protein